MLREAGTDAEGSQKAGNLPHVLLLPAMDGVPSPVS